MCNAPKGVSAIPAVSGSFRAYAVAVLPRLKTTCFWHDNSSALFQRSLRPVLTELPMRAWIAPQPRATDINL